MTAAMMALRKAEQLVAMRACCSAVWDLKLVAMTAYLLVALEQLQQ